MVISIELLQAIGIWFSGVLVFVSIVFLLLQIRYLIRSIRGSVYQNVYEAMMKISFFLVEHIELKPYFYDSMEVNLKDALYPKIMAAAELCMDSYENVYYQRDVLPRVWYKEHTNFVRAIYKSSPALQRYLTKNEAWYNREFVEWIRK